MSQQTTGNPGGAGTPGAGGRPGAMTMAMQAVAAKPSGPKVLRIGLIQGGKIVEERIVRRRETVSIGTSEKNHFIVANASLPSRFEIFQLVGNDYILNFTETMNGRVGLPGGVRQLDELRRSGGARNAGSHFQIKLNDNSRGKVVVGDTTLLFQFVVPPPITPRPQLPASARGGFVAAIDWLFTAFVVFAYMTFFGGIVYLENADWPIQQGLASIPDSLAEMIFDEPEPPPEAPPPEDTPSDDTPVADDTPTTAPTEHARNDAASSQHAQDVANAGASAEARARIAEEAGAQAEAMILGALGEGGALNDVLAGGAVTGNAEEVLAQASGVGVASSGTGGTLRSRSGGGGSGQAGGLGGLRGSEAAGQAAGEGTTVVERVIRGRINLEAGGDIGGSGDFDSSVVVRTIRTRIRAIQRCYETELRRNPTLAGKVTVQFTIVERGTVSGAHATENTTGSPAVASCVVDTISRFRFNPGPEGGSVNFSYPFVFAPQN